MSLSGICATLVAVARAQMEATMIVLGVSSTPRRIVYAVRTVDSANPFDTVRNYPVRTVRHVDHYASDYAIWSSPSESARNGTEFSGRGEMTQLLHDLSDAWATLGIGRSTLYELINAGEINTVKIGRRTLIPHEELVRYVRTLQDAHAA